MKKNREPRTRSKKASTVTPMKNADARSRKPTMTRSSDYTVGQVADLLSSCKQHVATTHDSEQQNNELLAMFGKSSNSTTWPVFTTRVTFGQKSVDEEDLEKKTKKQERRNEPALTTESSASKNIKKTDSSTNSQTTNTERPRKQKEPKVGIDNSARTVFVGNLPVSVDKKMLMKLFGKFGEIKNIRFRSLAPSDPSIPKRRVAHTKQVHPERNAMNAYIVFQTEEAAQKALKRNGKLIGNHHIRVDLASNSKTHNTKHSVFLGNLPFDVSDDVVRAHFEQCGSVENVRIIRDPKTGLGKGFGYLLFAEDVCVEFALKLDGSRLAARNIRVQRATKHKQRNANAFKRLQKKEFVKGKDGASLQVGAKLGQGRPRESKSDQMRSKGNGQMRSKGNGQMRSKGNGQMRSKVRGQIMKGRKAAGNGKKRIERLAKGKRK